MSKGDAKMSGLVNQIKNEVKRAGTNKGKFVFIREGEKRRFRFLTDADDGMEITFHDNFAGGVVPTPCQEIFGRDCPYCNEEDIRTRSQLRGPFGITMQKRSAYLCSQ